MGGVSVRSGGSLSLNAKDAMRAEKGLCQFSVEIAVRNAGAAASGAFKSTLTAAPGRGSWEVSWAGLAAGAAETEKGAVGLPPGASTLVLTIDPADSVKEADEKNNRFTVQTTVAGDCEPRSLRAPTPAIVPPRRQ